ncbi:MAG: hypothetical protein Q7S51_01850 [Gallionellaceae bacterium]|nr:hypothetical protein [Gallionellaceae bacterium]
MNPQIAWQTWRRIMREPKLQATIFDEGKENIGLTEFNLSNEEREVALYYASKADRAQWFVLNYRFRLANSFLNALDMGAPLVLRTLLAKGIDLQALGVEFLDQNGWRDFGPYVYTYCKDALQFLSTHPVAEKSKGLRELIGLEQTVLKLLVSLSVEPGQPVPNGLLERTPFASYYRCEVHLSKWMRDKKLLGITSIEDGIEHYLIYLPDLKSTHKFALLPSRAAEIYISLAQPCTRMQLTETLNRLGFAGHTDQDEQCLNTLIAYRAINVF